MRQLSSFLCGSVARTLTVGAVVLYVSVSASAVIGARQAPAGAVAGPSVWDGVFTADQAARGRLHFIQNCAECHGSNLEGGEGKPLSGDRFWRDWQETTVDYMFGQMSKNMPFSEDGSLAGTLPRNTYIDIAAHLLLSNGFPSGSKELTPESSAGVRIIPKDGSRGLPDGAGAYVMGCLTRGEGGKGWKLTKATRPGRMLSTTKPDPATPPGDREIALMFVITPLDKFAGQRMLATGSLMGESGAKGINVSSVAPIAGACS